MRKFTKILKTLLMVAVVAVSVGMITQATVPEKVHAEETANPAGTEAILSPNFKNAYYRFVYDAVSFQKGTKDGYEASRSSGYVEIQDLSSPEKIYMWHDSSNNFYWYSPADTVYLPADSSGLFNKCDLKTIDLEGFNTSNVTNMANMFNNCEKLTSLNIGNFDTSKVTNMSGMFNECGSLENIDVGNWDTSKVTNMGSMFNYCTDLTSLDVSKWDTSNATDMSSMFHNCWELANLDISNFNMANVTTTKGMFNNCYRLKTIVFPKNIDTSKVNNMSNMFYGCWGLASLDVSSFNTSKVTDMSNMFYGCSKLPALDVSKWNTSNAQNMNGMFSGCSSIATLDVSKFNTSKTTNMSDMFAGCSELPALDVGGFDMSNVTDASNMFNGCSKLPALDVSKWNTSNVGSMYGMFDNCESLEKLDISKWNTSNATNMGNMFNKCESLTSLDVSKWDTSNVTSMYYMFGDCSSITALDVSMWNTSKVTDMSYMFSGCSKLANLDVSKWDTSKVTDMNTMFSYCSDLTNLDVSHFDTSKVTDMNTMFAGCSKLANLDVSNWDTSKVTNMGGGGMFAGCSKLAALDVSKWDTSNVWSMIYMFSGCSNLTGLDINKWDTSNVTNMGSMFDDCEKLEEIDMGSLDLSKVTDERDAFDGLASLKRITFPTSYPRDPSSDESLRGFRKVVNGAYEGHLAYDLRDLDQTTSPALAGTWEKVAPHIYNLAVVDKSGQPITNYLLNETDLFVYGQDEAKTGYYTTQVIRDSVHADSGTVSQLKYPDKQTNYVYSVTYDSKPDTSVKDSKSVYTLDIAPDSGSGYGKKTVTIRAYLTDGLSTDPSLCEIDGATFDPDTNTLTVTLEKADVKYDMTLFQNITGDSVPDKYSFSAVITPDDENCPMPSNTDSWYDATKHTVTLDSSDGGRARTLNFTATAPGTYGYTVTEVKDGRYGWDYDAHTYHVTYTIADGAVSSIVQTVDGTAITDAQKDANATTYKAYTGSDPASKDALVVITNNHFTPTTPTGFYDSGVKPLIVACAVIGAAVLSFVLIRKRR